MQNIFFQIIFWDRVIIILHEFDSNSKHTILIQHTIFVHFLEIRFCDMRLVLIEHITYRKKDGIKVEQKGKKLESEESDETDETGREVYGREGIRRGRPREIA